MTEALSLDAAHIVGLATGEASEGALAHAVAPPLARYRDSAGRRAAVVLGAIVVGGVVFALGWVAVLCVVGAIGAGNRVPTATRQE